MTCIKWGFETCFIGADTQMINVFLKAIPCTKPFFSTLYNYFFPLWIKQDLFQYLQKKCKQTIFYKEIILYSVSILIAM